jgi:hypothetical protein
LTGTDARADEDGFKARAGVLTLLTMVSASPQEELLELLEQAPGGGVLGPIPSDLTYEEMEAVYDAELARQ